MKVVVQQKHLSNLDLLNETVRQIQKDFDESEIEITFSGNPQTAYAELCDQLTPAILRLRTNDEYKLLNILYRIDIPEKAYKEAQMDAYEGNNTLVDLIVKRELQKVVLRHHFSGKKY